MAVHYLNRVRIRVDGVERSAELLSYEVVPEEGDDDQVTFASSRDDSGFDWRFRGTLRVDDSADTLWDLAMANTGEEVAVIIEPHLDATVSATTPHHTFTAIPRITPGNAVLGGEATTNTRTFATHEFDWSCTAPVRDTTP